MKKVVMVATALALVVGLGSCKSKKSAYRKAYEEAKQREIAAQTATKTVVYEETPAQKATETPTPPAPVRRERVSTYEGERSEYLKRYSVVIGSFQNPTNARALREKMTNKGYNAVLAKNEVGMLRVIVSSFSTKEEAIASREAVKSRFAPDFKDAWILENE